jgi:hypothetical protein
MNVRVLAKTESISAIRVRTTSRSDEFTVTIEESSEGVGCLETRPSKDSFFD